MYTDYVDNQVENENEDYYSDDNNNNNSSSNNDNKEKIKKIAIIAGAFCILLIILVLVAKGCSNRNNNNSNNGGQANVEPTIVIDRKSVTLEVGEKVVLTGDVLNTKEDEPIIVWYSEDTEIASVDDDGTVIANKEGTTVVVATYNGIQTSCEVIVTSNVVKAKSIKITQGSIELKKGKGTLIQYEVEPKEAKVENVKYTTDNPSVATVSDTGYVNAIDVGVTTITITADNNLKASVTVKVVSSGSTVIEPTSLRIKGLSRQLVVGSTATVLTEFVPNNATNKTLVWSSSNPSIATVDNNGNLKGIAAGKCTILASTYNGITARLDIEVQSNTVSVSSIQIVGDTVWELPVSSAKRIKYQISPSNATNQGVTFQSSNRNVAIVDSNGMVATTGVGTAIITVKTNDGNKTAIITVKVKANSSTPTDNPGSGEGGGSGSTENPGSSTTCTSYEMITIENNQKSNGTKVSTISFANAVAYKNSTITPGITVTQVASCVTDVIYNIIYGKTEQDALKAAVSYTGRVTSNNQTINFNKGDGYYILRIKAKDTASGTWLTKDYYAIVAIGTQPKLSVKFVSYNTTTKKAKLNFISTSTNGTLKEYKYCKTKIQGGCTITTNSTIVKASNTYHNTTFEISANQLETVCAVVYNSNGVASERQCVMIK